MPVLTVGLGDHLAPDLSGEDLDLLVEDLTGYSGVPHTSHGSQQRLHPCGSKLGQENTINHYLIDTLIHVHIQTLKKKLTILYDPSVKSSEDLSIWWRFSFTLYIDTNRICTQL